MKNFRLGFPIDGGNVDDSYAVMVHFEENIYHKLANNNTTSTELPYHSGAEFIYERLPEEITNKFKFTFEIQKKLRSLNHNVDPSNLNFVGQSDAVCCAISALACNKYNVDYPLILISACPYPSKKELGLRKMEVRKTTKGDICTARKSLMNKWMVAVENKAAILILNEEDAKVLCELLDAKAKSIPIDYITFENAIVSSSKQGKPVIVSCKDNQFVELCQFFRISKETLDNFGITDNLNSKQIKSMKKIILGQYAIIFALVLLLFIRTLKPEKIILGTSNMIGSPYQVVGNFIKNKAPFIEIDFTEGSVENLQKLALKQQLFCLAQSDVIKSKELQNTSNYKAIASLLSEKVTMITLKDLKDKDLTELDQKKINVTGSQSGSCYTAEYLFNQLKINIKKRYILDIEESFSLLRKNEIDAIFLTISHPYKTINQQFQTDSLQTSNLIFFPIEVDLTKYPELSTIYQKAFFSGKDYNFLDKDINTLSVPCVLTTYDGANYNDIKNLTLAICKNADVLYRELKDNFDFDLADKMFRGIPVQLHEASTDCYIEFLSEQNEELKYQRRIIARAFITLIVNEGTIRNSEEIIDLKNDNDIAILTKNGPRILKEELKKLVNDAYSQKLYNKLERFFKIEETQDKLEEQPK